MKGFGSCSARCLLVVGLLSVVVGCAQSTTRNDALSLLRDGQYEQAIAMLEEGIEHNPNDVGLRGSLLSVREEATARLIAQASQQRSEEKFEEAAKTLDHAIRLDPGNERLRQLRDELVVDSIVQGKLKAIDAQLSTGNKTQAMRFVSEALQISPRHPTLLALQRRLTTELRAESRSQANVLTENRPISLDFRDVGLATVLEAITADSGINFVLDRDVPTDEPVTVHLRSVRVDDAIDMVTSAHGLARRIVDSRTVFIFPNTPEKRKEHQEQVIRVFHLANAKAQSTAALLRSMLKIQEPFVDERANIVALRESPELIAMAERLVALHDVGEAEVMLEVEILEVKTTRLTELGLNFPSRLSLTLLPTSGLTWRDVRNADSGSIGVDVGSLVLNLRKEVGDVNILANPRIRTKSREKAEIMIGDKVPVFTSTSGATGFVSENVTYLDVGLKLAVEPLISPDDEIDIKLGLEVSSLVSEVTTSNGSTAYRIGTRNATTTLRLRDGETQVLAGLINNEDRSVSNRVPGLGDLPIAGRLFSSQKDDLQRTELVLAITPRILRGAPAPGIDQAEFGIGSEDSPRLRPTKWEMPFSDRSASSIPSENSKNRAATPMPIIAEPIPALSKQQENPPIEREEEGPFSLSNGTLHDDVGSPIQLAWVAPRSVHIGEIFEATLHVRAQESLQGIPLEIVFPAQYAHIESVTEGRYMRRDGGLTSFTHIVNAEDGKIGVGLMRNAGSPITGHGSLLSVKVKALRAGKFSFSVSSAQPMAAGTVVTTPELPSIEIQVLP